MNRSSLSPVVVPAVLAITTVLAAPTAQAQIYEAVRLYAAPPGQDGGAIGAVAVAGTRYLGSDKRGATALPVIDYQWANGWFAGVGNGVGYNFSSNPMFQYGLRVTADFGRKESRAAALRGMGDVDFKPEGGAFFNVMLPQGFAITTSARYGSGNEGRGLVVDIGGSYATMLAPQWRFSVGAGATLANANHLQNYFGVTSAQAASSGYRVFTPEGGVRDVRAGFSLTYAFDLRTRVTAAVTDSTLVGDSADSPLVRQKRTVSGLVAITRSF